MSGEVSALGTDQIVDAALFPLHERAWQPVPQNLTDEVFKRGIRKQYPPSASGRQLLTVMGYARDNNQRMRARRDIPGKPGDPWRKLYEKMVNAALSDIKDGLEVNRSLIDAARTLKSNFLVAVKTNEEIITLGGMMWSARQRHDKVTSLYVHRHELEEADLVSMEIAVKEAGLISETPSGTQ